MKSIARAFAWHYLLTTTTTTTPVGAFVASVPRSRAVPSATATSASSTSNGGMLSLFGVYHRDEIIARDEEEEEEEEGGERRCCAARRSLLLRGVVASFGLLPHANILLSSTPEAFADFAPGGTLLDRPVSVSYGNIDASPSRSRDNSNVLFDRDNYYKFGSAAPWIDPPGSIDFPKTMPFVPVQQRYDALKKYGARISASRDVVARVGKANTVDDVPERTDPIYQLRALGLLANSFFATENTGTTNELMLARWYINEMYLRIGDYRDALSRGGGYGGCSRVLRLPAQGDEFVPEPAESIDI